MNKLLIIQKQTKEHLYFDVKEFVNKNLGSEMLHGLLEVLVLFAVYVTSFTNTKEHILEKWNAPTKEKIWKILLGSSERTNIIFTILK